MLETEKERLLCEQSTQHKPLHSNSKKNYVEYNLDCDCETICEKCYKGKTSVNTQTECQCRNDCAKCRKTKKSRVNRICKGAATILSGRPHHTLYLICFVFAVIVLLTFLLILIIIMLLQHYHPPQKTYGINKRHSLCKEITPENSSLFIMGYVDGSSEKAKEYIDPTKNIFYVINKPISQEQACNIESILRLMTDKLVYILEFYKSPKDKNDYITTLQKRYKNLNRVKTNQTHYFEGSLFENISTNYNAPLSILAAKVLAVWQFGGMALSENIILNNRDVIDNSRDICFSDRDVIYCPQECSAYMFELMKVISSEMKSNRNYENMENVIDTSVDIYCGSNEAAKTGCNRVNRLKNADMCESDSGNCQFIRMNFFKNVKNAEAIRRRFCPLIMSH